MNKKIIVLLNGKAQSGKDQTYEFIKEYFNERCQRWAFADELKKICKEYFNWDGNKDDNGRNLLIKVGQILRGEISYSNGHFIMDTSIFNPNDKIYKYSSGYNYYNPINESTNFSLSDSISILEIFYKLLKDYKPYKDFWVEKIWNKIIENSFEINVITDFRFLNEYKYFWDRKETWDLKIKTINIKRENSLKLKDRSETELDNFKFDTVINNNGSLEDLKNNVFKICEEIEK
jgi:hypothetical protein